MNADYFYKNSKIREHVITILSKNSNNHGHYLIRRYKNLILGFYETFLIQETKFQK